VLRGSVMADDLGEKCGIFGVYQHPEAAKLTYLGLYALQHRGQESSGIVSSDGNTLHAEIGMGLVADVFNERRLAKLPGHMAIGHNRYSTTGSTLLRNAQPMVIGYAGGSLAIGHNGNIVNAIEIRQDLEQQGAIFRSTTDTEVIVHLIARSTETRLADQVVDALRRVQGAYSLLLMTEKELIGVRDPYGFRPLVLGRLGEETYILSSETCALDLIEAEYVRDIEPGEMAVIREGGVEFFHPFPQTRHAFCIFEYIYFARPDSIVFEKNVYPIRHPSAGLRGSCSTRICRRSGDPIRDGVDSQSLCRSHLHRASAGHSPFRRQGEIESGQTLPAWQARRGG
jgi:amidophosphoribosyltransferase